MYYTNSQTVTMQASVKKKRGRKRKGKDLRKSVTITMAEGVYKLSKQHELRISEIAETAIKTELTNNYGCTF